MLRKTHKGEIFPAPNFAYGRNEVEFHSYWTWTKIICKLQGSTVLTTGRMTNRRTNWKERWVD